MADRLTALGAVLGELDVPLRIDTVQDRLVIQKAIYLAQMAVPLGYSYGWYLKGPYSPRLTRDYYEFSQLAFDNIKDVQLKDSVRFLLRPIKALIERRPAHATLPQWLELLASLQFMKKNWNLALDAARQKVGETKPHLAHLVDTGWEALQH